VANTILGAIYQRFQSTVAASAASGGLWFNEVPEEKSAFPFVSLFDDGSTPDYTTENEYTEKEKFHFEVYAAGLSAVGNVVKQINRAFNLPGTAQAKTAFVVDGGEAIGCQLQRTVFASVGERGNTGEMVFQGTISFELWVRYSLATS